MIDQYLHTLALNPDDTSTLAKIAQYYIDNKFYSDAENYLLKLAKLVPQNAKIQYFLGILSKEQENMPAAIRYFNNARILDPTLLESYLELGLMYQLTDAIETADKILIQGIKIARTQDNNYMTAALTNLRGNICINTGELETAIKFYQEAIEIAPDFILARLNLVNMYILRRDTANAKIELANIHNATDDKEINYSISIAQSKILALDGRLNESIALLNQYSTQNPADKRIYHSLAKLYATKGDHNNAELHYNYAIEYDPKNISLLQDAIYYYFKEQDYAKVRELSNTLLKISPRNIFGYLSLCQVCLIEGNILGAIHCSEIAVNINNDSHIAHIFLAFAYFAANDRERAAKELLHGLELSPNDPDVLAELSEIAPKATGTFVRKTAYNSFKNILENFRRDPSAPVCYTHGQAKALVNYAYCCLQDGFWDEYEEIVPLMKKIIDEQLGGSLSLSICSFVCQFTLDDNNYHKIIAQKESAAFAVENKYRFHIHKKKLSSQLRIGYISPDFNKHVVGFLIGNLFSYHNRNNITVYGYHIAGERDEQTQVIQNSCDIFRDLRSDNVEEAAKKVYADNIDILIDLAGFTGNARPRILSYQPAPIQAHFLGQTNTMGADYVQYHFSTELMTPTDILDCYTETLVYLPDSIIAVEQYKLPDEPPSYQKYKLPEDKFVFCCFNNNYRIDKNIFIAWLEILKSVPDSVLWLNYISHQFIYNACAYAKAHGVDPDRLIFRQHQILNTDWHHRLADLYLDTAVVSGGTTGILSAWIGLPVLTLAGKTPQARFGAGIMHSAGLNEIIVHSLDEYIATAIKLAHNKALLKSYSDKLLQARSHVTLFNQAKYAAQLEQAFQAMYEHHYSKSAEKIIAF